MAKRKLQRMGKMKKSPAKHGKNSEAGMALLISIFMLLLISAVAISMIVAAGRETSLNGNYRSSAGGYYASVSGLEEARGRLLPSNVNYFNNTVAGFIPAGTLPVGQVRR
jgi:Tfp pilus assembly protein PilX